MRVKKNNTKTLSATRLKQPIFAIWLFSLSLAGLSCAPAEDTSPYSSAQLISEHSFIQAGEAFTVGINISLDEGWHTYWRNPGDAGQPVSITWELPDGFSAGEILWPFPHIVEESTVVSYGYENEVLLLAEVTPGSRLSDGESVTLEGDLRWLVCNNICLPATAEVSLRLRVEEESPSINDEWAALFSETRGRLPVEPTNWEIGASLNSAGYSLEVKPPSSIMPTLENFHFFVIDRDILVHGAQQVSLETDGSITLTLTRSPYAEQTAERLEGVLVFPDDSSPNQSGLNAVTINALVEGNPPTN